MIFKLRGLVPVSSFSLSFTRSHFQDFGGFLVGRLIDGWDDWKVRPQLFKCNFRCNRKYKVQFNLSFPPDFSLFFLEFCWRTIGICQRGSWFWVWEFAWFLDYKQIFFLRNLKILREFPCSRLSLEIIKGSHYFCNHIGLLTFDLGFL